MIGNPGVVVFDEVHFGGFAAKYLRGEFFSLICTLPGKIIGYAVGMAERFQG